MTGFRMSVKSDMDRAARELGPRLARQVTFAAALALTRTAQHIRDAQERELRDVFDRPTPYTLRSLRLIPATKAKLRARVWLKDDGTARVGESHYLLPQIRGGTRSLKAFERMLRDAGVLPAGMFIVPGAAAKLDAYGNLARGQLVQILSYFRSFGMAGYSANMNDKGRAKLARTTKAKQGFAYFVARPGDGRLPPGIYQRFNLALGSAIKPVLIFVDGVRYERRYPFGYLADRVRKLHWPAEWRRALNEAKASAR
jgi:hypothetical protein